MQIIEANKEFNSEDMHLGLMLYGYYCYHDENLKNIVPENIEWNDEPSIFGTYGTAICDSASKILKETQFEKYKEYYPDLKLVSSSAYYNVDDGAGFWHTDARENMTIHAVCYQTDFRITDGGSLQIKCYDGIERHYYPKNGDVVIMNHSTELEHKVDKILTDKKRVAVNMLMI
jgi:hypothetical protein